MESENSSLKYQLETLPNSQPNDTNELDDVVSNLKEELEAHISQIATMSQEMAAKEQELENLFQENTNLKVQCDIQNDVEAKLQDTEQELQLIRQQLLLKVSSNN